MDGSVLAAWAGAAPSLFGAGLTVWWPWHNRPQADWTLLEHSTNPELPISSTVPGFSDWLESRDEAEPDSVCSVYNSGDGDAYDVSTEGIGCKAYFLLLRPIGDNTEFMTPSSIAQFKAADRAYIIMHADEKADVIAIRLHWTKQPTHLMRRVFRSYSIHGSLPEQPRHPIPETRRHLPTLTRYRFEHSRLGLWLFAHPRLHPLSRTLDTPPTTGSNRSDQDRRGSEDKARERLNKPAVSDMHAGSHVSLITHPLPVLVSRGTVWRNTSAPCRSSSASC